MQLGQSQYIIKITDSFFNGELKELFIDIVSHRIFISPQAKYQGKSEKLILKEIMDSTAVPLEV